jgi:hypothetical protein
LFGAELNRWHRSIFSRDSVTQNGGGTTDFEQQQLILEWCWKFKVVLEVQSLWTREIETARPESSTI